MAKLNSLKTINRRYHASIKALTKGAREKEILASLSNGKNTYLRLDRVESSAFDKTWIEIIEDVIFDLGEIIANPKQVTKAEGTIVPVELARKINAESVQHLASHTQYIKEIDDYGNVIPSKVLSIISEDDIRTYENRFIATFVRRLILFVEKRYEIVSKFAELHDEEVLFFKNKSFVDGANVEIETKIKISHKSDDELSIKSNAYVARIKQMRQYILYFYNSDFMHKLKTEKDVHNPILQTNIIRKNPKYHHCYEVYKFLERYDSLGVHYKVDEHYSLFNEDEMQEINRTLFANYITLRGKDRSKDAKTSTKVYKPKILTSMDDESFIYGPLLSGPIEFVRIDEGYQKYLDSKLRKDLPLHPTKHEKEYYADEYAEKAENKQDLKQKNDLIKRVEKEVKAFNKKAEKIDKEREEARLALLRQEQEIIRQEENEMLAQARQELIDASLQDKQAHDEEEQRKEQELIANIKPAEVPTEMSHPVSEPVTYEQAVDQIWPGLSNVSGQPIKEEQPAPINEAPVVETAHEEQEQQQDIKPAVVPVEMSHPYSKPVNYDEAVNEIWPQLLNNKPASNKVSKENKKAAKEQPVKIVPVTKADNQEAPVEEQPKVIKPAVVPVEMSHPISAPVTYEEALDEIWPGLSSVSGQPLLVEDNNEQEEQSLYAPEDIKPAVVPVEMSHPMSAPVSYDEAVDQIWPQLLAKPEPVEQPVNEEPSENEEEQVEMSETEEVKDPEHVLMNEIIPEVLAEPVAQTDQPVVHKKKKKRKFPIQTREEIEAEYRYLRLRGIAIINFNMEIDNNEKEIRRVVLKEKLKNLREAKLRALEKRERKQKEKQQQEEAVK